MYLLIALLIAFMNYLILLKGYVFNSGIKNSYKITKEDIEKNKGNIFYYSKYKGLFEIFGSMSISILILMFAFQETDNEKAEMVFMIIGMVIFLIAFLRCIVILNVKVRYTDKYLYIYGVFKERRYDLRKINYIDHASMHLILRTPDYWFLVFIPVGLSNIDIIYKLIKNNVDIKNGVFDDYE